LICGGRIPRVTALGPGVRRGDDVLKVTVQLGVSFTQIKPDGLTGKKHLHKRCLGDPTMVRHVRQNGSQRTELQW
jgi:hypothetical protein